MIVHEIDGGTASEMDNARLSSIEQIRNDLENDDIFSFAYRGIQPSQEKNEDLLSPSGEQQPDFEWLKTTSDLSVDGGDDEEEEFKEAGDFLLNS